MHVFKLIIQLLVKSTIFFQIWLYTELLKDTYFYFVLVIFYDITLSKIDSFMFLH